MAAGALLVLVACNGTPKAAPPGATVGTAPAQTTSTDPFAAPDAIDTAYVNRVLAGLDSAVGDVVRMVVAAKIVPREGFDRLKAIYGTDALLNLVLDALSQDAARGFPGVRSPPGNQVTIVTELISASRACIYSKVKRDYSKVSVGTALTEDNQWIAVRPLDKARDPYGYNSVGWSYAYEGFERGNVAPNRNPCG